MLTLEELKPGISLVGIEPTAIITVISVVPISDGAVQVIYRTPDGILKERMLGHIDEESISIATIERPWSFDGDGETFKLTVEAKRIDLAFLFDPMMAVHTSNLEPLPHQITAVYETMLPQQPLRFVLADDPGAGKTIMAGLYIRELIMRADARRILIVAPGSLVEQWRDELFEKFGLEFKVYTTALGQSTPSGNPFDDIDHLIVRLDKMSRNKEPRDKELQDKLCATTWDLVVFDEAHKLSAHFFGSELKKTKRFLLAEKVGAHTHGSRGSMENDVESCMTVNSFTGNDGRHSAAPCTIKTLPGDAVKVLAGEDGAFFSACCWSLIQIFVTLIQRLREEGNYEYPYHRRQRACEWSCGAGDAGCRACGVGGHARAAPADGWRDGTGGRPA